MNEAIVEARNLCISFPMRVHQQNSFRDAFVRAASSPLEFFFRPVERLEVLRDLNLEVRRGDRLALIGVNGTGKTTLCRILADVYRPDSGRAVVNGEVRAIFDTMVGIFPDLTGRENAQILIALLYPQLPETEKASLLADALEFSELGDFLNTPFKFYSNGMQTRLCLSVLTMRGTDLLILDEVFEGADQFFREKISKRVLRMIENSGAVIFVSHNQDQLLRVCNRAVVLENRRVAFDGSVVEALAYYEKSHAENRP